MTPRVGFYGVSILLPIVLSKMYHTYETQPEPWLLARLLYWYMALLTIGAVVIGSALLWHSKFNLLEFLKKNSHGISLALGLTVAVVILIPPEMKVQFDETALVEASQTMHLLRANFEPFEALPTGGPIEVIRWELDKRPPIFPFLVSLLHDFRGVRIENAFFLNGFFLFLLLSIVFVWVRKTTDFFSAVSAQLWLLSSPITLWCATSAGFDFSFSVVLVALNISALAFLREPRGEKFRWFLSLGLLTCYWRYEGLFVFFYLLGVTLFLVRNEWKMDRSSKWLSYFLPTLLLPLWLHYDYISHHEVVYAFTGGAPLFDVRNILSNGPKFVREFFGLIRLKPFFGPLNFLSLILIVYILVKRRLRPTEALVLGSGVVVLGTALFYVAGDATVASAARLFLYPAILASLGPLLAMRSNQFRISNVLLLLASLTLFGVQLFDLSRNGHTLRTDIVAVTEELDELFPKIEKWKTNALFVSDFPYYFIMHGFASIYPTRLESVWPNLKKSKLTGEKREVFFVVTPELEKNFADSKDIRSVMARFEVKPFASKKYPVPLEIFRLSEN